MKTMLMGTDLSTRSDRAFERALLLARQHKTELNVLHIVDAAVPESTALNQKDEAEQSLRKHISSLQAGEAPVITAEVKIGKGSEDILGRAQEKQAELIILGVRDAGHGSFFRGTLCDHIVRKGDLPVLVVKDRPANDYERVVVAVDFSVHSRRAIETALSLAPKAEIYLVHAYQVPFEGRLGGPDARREVSKRELERMKRMVEEEMMASLRALREDTERLHQVLRHGDVRQVIRQEVKRLKADLLALGTHGRTGIAHAFLGSVAEDLLTNPPCDAVAVKA